MSQLRETATLTSKGQITLPRSIRQLLGVEVGGKVAFDMRDGQIVVTRLDVQHEDPAIGAFLSVLEQDIRNGMNLRSLPDDLLQPIGEQAEREVDLDEEINGDVEI